MATELLGDDDMEAGEIRKLRLADPFVPFRIEMADGRSLAVERPSYLAISPNGRSLMYALPKGGFEYLKPDLIVSAVVDPKLSTIWRRPA